MKESFYEIIKTISENEELKICEAIEHKARQGKVLQESVHASTRQILCRGLNCKIEFLPTRKHQVFCSTKCRERYFMTARSLGLMLLKESRVDTISKIICERFMKALDDRFDEPTREESKD